MSYVSVEVDLNEFRTSDLIDEIEERIDYMKKSELQQLQSVIGSASSNKIDTLEKQMKYDFFMQNIENIPLERLERAVYEPFK